MLINNITVSIAQYNQIGEGRGAASQFRTSFNFTVPALPALMQTTTMTVTVSFLQQRRQASNASFKLKYQVVPAARVTFCIPTIGSLSGGNLFVLGVQGFVGAFSASDIRIVPVNANGPNSNQSELTPRILSWSTNAMASTFWFTASEIVEGEKPFILKNQATSQTVVQNTSTL